MSVNNARAKINRIIYLLIFLFQCAGTSFAQDIQFSQFYATPLYLNPAFAGSAHMHRAISHNRLQWPGLEARYYTSLLSVDTYLPQYNSGFGLIGYFDNQGGRIKSTRIAAQYSYEVTLSPNLFFRPGLEVGYLSRKLDYSQLIFSDQVTDTGILTSPETPSDRVHMVDISSGALIYSKQFWFGISGHHLNRPNQSFLGETSRLPTKLAFVSGYKIKIGGNYGSNSMQESAWYIIPTAHYKLQGKSDQFDVGLYGLKDIFLAGVWYRGIPLKFYEREDNRFHNNESLVFLAGIKIQSLSVGYSYDWVVSRLSRATTNGAHELNITYVFDGAGRKRIPKRLPCPSF